MAYATDYIWPRGHTHARHKHTDVLHKSDFKKPGVRQAGRRAPGLELLFYLLYVTNKTECFNFKSGCVIWVVKHLKQDWLIVLR